MAEEVLGEYSAMIESLELIPSSGGVFVVEWDGDIVFSKHKENRFPNEGEMGGLIAELLG